MTLQTKPNATIVYDNVEYNFFPYYNRVLTLLTEVFPSEELTDAQKIYLTVNTLVKEKEIEQLVPYIVPL